MPGIRGLETSPVGDLTEQGEALGVEGSRRTSSAAVAETMLIGGLQMPVR